MKEVWFVNKNRCATVIYFDKKLEFECLELIFYKLNIPNYVFSSF